MMLSYIRLWNFFKWFYCGKI